MVTTDPNNEARPLTSLPQDSDRAQTPNRRGESAGPANATPFERRRDVNDILPQRTPHH